MDDRPLFTIAMATYNRAQILPRAVNSVLNQTYQNFELVIVDDGSTDNTEETCRSFGDKRIIYHRQEANRGVLAARNKGLELATGDCIALLDDDDELLPDALETAAARLAELAAQGIKIVWFDGVDSETSQRSGSGLKQETYLHYEDLLCERMAGDFWQVMRRDIITEEDRFDERLWCGEVLLWLRLHRKAKAYYVPKVLRINHRQHGGERVSGLGSMLKHVPQVVLTNKAILAEYGEEKKRVCPKVYGRRLGILGIFQILDEEGAVGRRACRKAFRYQVSPPYVVVYLLSFLLSGSQIRRILERCVGLVGSS